MNLHAVKSALVKTINPLLKPFGGVVLPLQDMVLLPFSEEMDKLGLRINLLEVLLRLVCLSNSAERKIVQIGANDGKRSDPYRPLIQKYGLQGVLVEPIPSVFEDLKSTYRDQNGLSFENSAIGTEHGVLPLYVVRDGSGVTSTCASFDRDLVLKISKGLVSAPPISSIQVPVLTFDELIDKHDIQQISLLAIDAEGWDYKILKSVNFEKVKPALISFEHDHLTYDEQIEACQFLGSKGYKIIRSPFCSDTMALLERELDVKNP